MIRLAMTATIATMLWATSIAAAADGEPFLGKSAAAWAGELKSESAAARHLAVWALAQKGPAAERELAAALAHDDPTVRYWAVRGLARIGGTERAEALSTLLKDRSQAVRVAAAEACVRLGRRELGLAVLIEGLSDPQEAVRVQAIDSLEKLGPLASPARAEIEKATGDQSEYVKRISTRMLAQMASKP